MVFNLNLNTHTMQEITLVEIIQVHLELVLHTQSTLMKINLRLQLNKSQSQFVLMPQIGHNTVVVSLIIVVLQSTMLSYLLDMKTVNTGSLKTHGLIHGEKLDTLD